MSMNKLKVDLRTGTVHHGCASPDSDRELLPVASLQEESFLTGLPLYIDNTPRQQQK